MILWFDFYDDSEVYIDSFGVQFPESGDFYWTISGPIGIVIPDIGIMEIVADTGSEGQWLLGEAGPTVGTEDPLFGTGAGYDPPIAHCFELSNTIPEPASMALLGLGGLTLLRRRWA